MTPSSQDLAALLNDARFFIQDSLTNGHLSGGDIGNLMAARDSIDRAKALLALAGDTSGGVEKIDNSSVVGAEVAASSGVKSDSREGH